MIGILRWAAVCAALGIGLAEAAAQGTIEGTVTDRATGDPVTGATVVVKGTLRGAACDAMGRYRIAGLDAGTYDLEVTMLTYAPCLIPHVEVRSGQTARADAALEEQREEIDQVVVTAVRRRDSEAAVNFDVRHAMMVVSGVSSQTIARTQDRDAGEVVRRIPGISLIDDKFVIARGLSQRYNNVWINGAAVPSSEADTRAFSFDLIPAGQIEHIMVLKSPAPEVPADFSGGFIRIGTKDMPAQEAVSIQYALGVNTETHFRRFLFNRGSGTDWLGFDNGKRGVSGGIEAPLDNGDAQHVTRMTREGFNNDWRVRSRRPIPDQRLAVAFGKAWSLRDGKKITLNGAVNYSYSSRTYAGMDNCRYGVYNKKEDKPEYLYKYTDDQYRTTVKAGAMLNVAFIGTRSRYYLRNLLNQVGQDRYTAREGWQNISSLYVQRKAEYLYTSRTTYNGQVAGVHEFAGSRLDWNAGYSYANKHVPDRRIVNLQENDLYGDAHYGEMGIDQNEIRRDFTRLREHIASAGINYELRMREGRKVAPTLRTGAYGEFRTRDYRARAFFYRFNPSNLPADFVYGDVVDEILQPGNYGADKLYIYDDSNNRDCYEGENLLAAAYAAINLPLGPLTLYAGVRFEHSGMDLKSYTRSKDVDEQNHPL
ncbi:MAG TPA: carboxypeptidase regulatory-like domain-containing protein [Rikenellaceae bacterium]|nr:carboxypeptidase regulatory-like domain-containing protein [Rikenellaceae bacterium]